MFDLSDARDPRSPACGESHLCGNHSRLFPSHLPATASCATSPHDRGWTHSRDRACDWHRPTPALASHGSDWGLALVAFIALGELWAGFINPYVSLTSTGFAISAVEISTGTPFHLQNPADGVRQVLCLGIDQTCQPQDGAPMVLNQGMQVQPGQIVTFSFDTTGTYHITSKVSPGMNLSVDVGEPSD